MMVRSGPVRLVIDIDMDEGLAHLVAKVASTGRRGDGCLSDANWFSEDLSQSCLDDLLGWREWDDLVPGLWVVEGSLWGEHIYSANGDDFDGGLDVEKAEPLTDVPALLGGWLEEIEDLNLCKRLHLNLMSEDSDTRAKALQRLIDLQETMSVLREIAEEETLKEK